MVEVARAETAAEYHARKLRYVADNIERYLPSAVLMPDTELVVRLPHRSKFPTVELNAEMLMEILED